jgi:hypothetical protein
VATDDPRERDPFDGLQLDESFVQGATVSEPAAAERIARLQRIDEEHRRLREGGPDRAHRHRALYHHEQRQRRRRWLATLTAIVAIGAVLSWSAVRSRGTGVEQAIDQLAPGLSVRDGAAAPVDGSTGRPPASNEERSRPIGTPADPPVDTGPFEFMAVQPDRGSKAVAYDPCRPIHLVVNGRAAPPSASLLLQRAVTDVSAATGLVFVVDGATDEAPTDGREAYQRDRYGDRWAPVLVAWTDPGESPRLAGDIAGEGGSASLDLPDGTVYVSGMVSLDGPQLARVLSVPGGDAVAEAIVLHELGHLVGLGHVDDPTQLMFPTTDGQVTDYAAGDRLGLRQLGQGRCFTEL